MDNKRQIILIFLTYCAITCVYNIYFIFGPFYEKNGASPGRVALFASVFFAFMMLGRPLGSFITEKLNIRRALMLGAATAVVSTSGIALCLGVFPALIFFRSMLGIAVGTVIVATVAAQSILLDEKSRGFGFALFTTASMLPLATALPLCEWFLASGRDALFLWSPAAASIACAVFASHVKDLDYAASAGKSWGSYAELFKTKGVAALLITCVVMGIGDSLTTSVASLAKERGVAAAAFMAADAVSAVFIRTVGYKFLSRISRALLAAPAAALIGLGAVGLSFASTATTFALFGTLFGLGIGVGYPTNLALVGDMLPKAFHPKATGLVLLLMDAGWVVSPLIYGLVSPVMRASGAFRLIGVSVAAAAALLFFRFWLPLSKKPHSAR